MTNKESIQAAHLEAINDNLTNCGTEDFSYNRVPQATIDCTNITAEAIGEAMEEFEKNWIWLDGMLCNVGVPKPEQVELTIKQWVELFLNQKAK